MALHKLFKTSKTLTKALNSRGYMISLSTKPFYGQHGEIRSYYTINNGVYDEEKQRYHSVELYSTITIARVVLYLRDLWYFENGWELPTDNETWNEIRKDINNYGKYR